MRKNWHLLAYGAAAAVVLFGTLTTANTTRTARHGVHLPIQDVRTINRALVQAWNPDDATLVRTMRDYVKGLAAK